MPLVKQIEVPGGKIILWEVTETPEQLQRIAHPGDLHVSEHFTSSTRIKSFLAWRCALRTFYPEAEISYDNAGAPVTDIPGLHISVSHTDTLAVVYMCARRCGIDTEKCARPVEAVAERFLSDREKQAAGFVQIQNEKVEECEHAVQLPPYIGAYGHLLFCSAKEVLYKLSGTRGLSFKTDLVIGKFNASTGELTANYPGIDRKRTAATLRWMVYRDHLIVYSVAGLQQSR